MSTKYTALITGASSGIGYELSKILAEKNFDLVLVARSRDKLDKLKKEILSIKKISTQADIKIKTIELDLALDESPLKLFEILKQESISITHLINNAGVGELNRFDKTDWDKLSQMMDLNIKALTHLSHLFLPELQTKPFACILNVSSIAAFLPGPNMAVYYATKAYVQSFTEALAEELSDSKVKVISLCPGPTRSGFQEAASISLDSPLFQGVPSSLDVALYAVKLMESNSRVGIHGLKNKAMVFSLRFLPRSLITKVVTKIQASRSLN